MPFTLAHPAAVVPLHRRLPGLSSLSALVLGCMVPDLVYALPGEIDRTDTHSLAGLFWFCVPAAVVLYVIFHVLVRPMACALLPRALRDRLPARAFAAGLPAASPAAVVVSALVGAATHLVWDSFTHDSGAVVQAWSLLQRPLVSSAGYTLTVYRVLQHGSTALGLALVALWIRRWWRSAPPRRDPLPWETSSRLRTLTITALLLVPASCGVAAGLTRLGDGPALAELRGFTARTVFTGGSVFLGWTLVVAIVWRALRGRAEP